MIMFNILRSSCGSIFLKKLSTEKLPKNVIIKLYFILQILAYLNNLNNKKNI